LNLIEIHGGSVSLALFAATGAILAVMVVVPELGRPRRAA
jgi:hypothetical protein